MKYKGQLTTKGIYKQTRPMNKGNNKSLLVQSSGINIKFRIDQGSYEKPNYMYPIKASIATI